MDSVYTKTSHGVISVISVISVIIVISVSSDSSVSSVSSVTVKAKISGKRMVQGTFFHRLWPIQFCVIALQTEMLFSTLLQLPK